MSSTTTKPAPPSVPALYEALAALRGCGCCADYNAVERVAPDACPVDEDGDKLHTMEAGCAQDFSTALRVFANAVRAEVTA